MNRTATLLLLLLTTCLSVLGQSMVHPTERWISSLHGVAGPNNTRPLAANKVLLVRDPELNYQLAYPNTYTARYEHRTSEAVVALRFNDTDRGLYTTAWTATVNYVLTTRDINGTVTVHPPATIAVNYDPTNPYTDIKEAYRANATWASLKVTSVTLTGGMAVPNDLYLDLRLDVDRHYDLTTTEKPTFTYKGVVAGDNTHYNVRWNYVEGAEAYDFEWVFVDTEGITGSTTALPYDFANATRITTTQPVRDPPRLYQGHPPVARPRCRAHRLERRARRGSLEQPADQRHSRARQRRLQFVVPLRLHRLARGHELAVQRQLCRARQTQGALDHLRWRPAPAAKHDLAEHGAICPAGSEDLRFPG
jgi:hypothetical protein